MSHAPAPRAGAVPAAGKVLALADAHIGRFSLLVYVWEHPDVRIHITINVRRAFPESVSAECAHSLSA